MTKKQKGFTLVELMIVVAIIGVLAAVAIPKFADMLEKSREGATKGNISAIKSSVSNYYADQQGVYPMTALTTATFTIDGAPYPAFIPNYIESLPAVKVTGKYKDNATADQNRGPGVGNLAAAVTTGIHTAPAFVADQTGKGWKYDPGNGNVWVNSSMFDMGRRSYTMFGYE